MVSQARDMNSGLLGKGLVFVWPIHPPRPPSWEDFVSLYTFTPDVLRAFNIAIDEFTLELVESLLSLIQTLKDTLNVCIRHWGVWQNIVFDNLHGNENSLAFLSCITVMFKIYWSSNVTERREIYHHTLHLCFTLPQCIKHPKTIGGSLTLQVELYLCTFR